MPGDYSRFTDDPKKRFAKVLAQQGRVTLDSDSNELVDVLTRRDRLQALDVFGPAAVPRATTPAAFQITTAGAPAGDLKIGAGRMYVRGLLAEAFDTDPLTYRTQPFYRAPDPPAISSLPAGKGLVYLDVWEQEITYVEDPSLLEPALGGVDTATRVQTVWQVKIASQKDFPGIACGTDLDKIFPPSDARLTVSVKLPAEPPDPCLPVGSGGFRDVENRHYRVEIHGSAPPKLKFARDPVVSEIEDIKAGTGETVIKVKRIGRDSVLRFSQNDCVEVLNDRRVLRNEPGIIARIKSIKEETREITIDVVVAASEMGKDANARELHARLIRWDQKGVGADPLNPIPTVAADLESGIQIKIAGTPRHGDYWMFPARAATNSAGPLEDAPPRGIIHQYAALAAISGLGTSTPTIDSDCRTLWPPPSTAGEDCECSACVTAEGHNNGTHTIEMAISEAKAKGGGKVCLKPGFYAIRGTIEIRDAQFLRLTGHGWAVLFFVGDNPNDPVIRVQSSADITLEGLILIRTTTRTNQMAISIRDCILDTVVQDCVILMTDTETARDRNPFPRSGIGIQLDGLVQDLHIQRNLLLSGTGVQGLQAKENPLAVLGADISENLMFGRTIGVRLDAFAIAANIARNWIVGADTGLSLAGTTVPGTSLEVDGNRIFTAIRGIAFGTDQTTISNNTILGPFGISRDPGKPNPSNCGIVAHSPNVEDAIDDCRIAGNRIARMEGYGIAIDSLARRMMIKQNFVTQTGGAGIMMLDRAAGSTVVIENNDLRDVAANDDPSMPFNAGIRIGPLNDAAVATNTISGVGNTAGGQRGPMPSAGIHADAPRSVRIHENRIERVVAALAPNSAAIDVGLPSKVAEITNNVVRVDGLPAPVGNHCYAVRVGLPAQRQFLVVRLQATTAAARRLSAGAATAFDLPQVVILESNLFLLGRGEASRALIRTNQLESFGPYFDRLSMVLVESGGNEVLCTFGGNMCAAQFVGKDTPLESCARFASQTLVADSNQLLGDFRVAMDIEFLPWTIVGNIVARPIMIADNAGVKTDLFSHVPPDSRGYFAVVNRRI